MNESNLSVRQFNILIMGFVIGSSILLAPSMLAAESKQDAWLAGVIGLAGGMAVIILLNALGQRFPQMTLMEYTEVIMGRWLGMLFNIIFFLFVLSLTVALIKYMVDFISTLIMPETPDQVISLMVMLLAALASYLGLTTIGRASQLLFPATILLFVVMVLLILPQIEFKNIQPVFDTKMLPLFRSAVHFTSIPYMELVVFLMLYPYVQTKTSSRNKVFVLAGWVGGVVLIIITLLCLLVLGADVTVNASYPSFSLARRISLGHIVERVEAILGVVWFITLFVKLSICYHVSILGFTKVLRLQEYRILLLPFVLVIVVLSKVIYPSTTYGVNFIMQTWPPYSLTCGVLLPLILLIVAACRGQKGAGG